MEQFIAKDKISKEILNSAKLLQTLNINALIIGDIGVGKKTLAKYILPKAKIYKAKILQEEIENNTIIIENKAIIVEEIHKITNIDLFLKYFETSNIRIIATSYKKTLNHKLKDIFSITLEIPSLEKRIEDTKELVKKFSLEVSKTFNMEQLEISKLSIDIKNNTKSLRKSIYLSYLFETIEEKDFLIFFESYLRKKLKKGKNYKDLLYIFEIPLLKAGQKMYKSQVKMAQYLNLNRITLRKKLDTYKNNL